MPACNRRAKRGARRKLREFNALSAFAETGVRQPLRLLGKFCRIFGKWTVR
jgi:hypothetical protein